MNLMQQWGQLTPKVKRLVAVSAIGVVILGAMALTTSPPEEKKQRGRHESIKSILTDKNTRDVGIDSISGSLKALENRMKGVEREQERIKKEGVNQKPDSTSEENTAESARMRADIDRLIDMVEAKNPAPPKGDEAGKGAEAGGSKPGGEPAVVQQSYIDQKVDFNDPASVFKSAPLPHTKKIRQHDHPGGTDTGESDDKQVAGLNAEQQEMRIVSISQAEEKSKSKPKEDESQTMSYLPAGSIITGTLINGMDAPTGQGARKDPFPSTLRIQKEAILPNKFRADVRECFMILSGYGDLSSERAYLRGETFSCIREDGGVIEARLDSYAVGEDGKAGVRGRLVSKQGQMVAKSLIAGFLGGASKAMDVNVVPTINTTGSNRTEFQSPLSSDLFQGAAVKGASSALDRIAKFYIEMAEGIFPVIEIDAGRQLDVIVTRGARLQIRNLKRKR